MQIGDEMTRPRIAPMTRIIDDDGLPIRVHLRPSVAPFFSCVSSVSWFPKFLVLQVARTARVGMLLAFFLAQFSRLAFAQSDRFEFFEKHVRPVLRRECLGCHREGKASGSLALDSRAGWTRGGDSGPAIVPGKPDDSLLIRAVRHQEDGLKMPAKAPKLADDVIQALETWIQQGAADPRDKPESFVEKTAAPWDEVARERAKWWCWQP